VRAPRVSIPQASKAQTVQLRNSAMAETTVCCSSSRSSGRWEGRGLRGGASLRGSCLRRSRGSGAPFADGAGRVVDLRADFALGEDWRRPSAAVGADNVLVPDGDGCQEPRGAGRCRGWDKGRLRPVPAAWKRRVIAAGDGAAELIPSVDVLELDGEDGALEAVHAGVPADLVVVVAAAHAVAGATCGRARRFHRSWW